MQRKEQIKNALLEAFPYTIPVLTGFLCLGTAYGILMQTKGYGVIWSVLMSLIAFCGSMQFVAITLLTSPFNPLQAFFLSLMVNARHLFYGISLLDKYRGLGKIRNFLIFALCDETFSISCSIEPSVNTNRKYFYFFVSLLNYIYWAFGTFMGGLIGKYIKFNTKGLDFALTALFIVLFIEMWKKKENKIPGFIGILCTTLSLLIFGKNNLIIPAMIIILAILLGGKKKLCN
jgi:4-azaleucine resistance transporter AzlC